MSPSLCSDRPDFGSIATGPDNNHKVRSRAVEATAPESLRIVSQCAIAAIPNPLDFPGGQPLIPPNVPILITPPLVTEVDP